MSGGQDVRATLWASLQEIDLCHMQGMAVKYSAVGPGEPDKVIQPWNPVIPFDPGIWLWFVCSSHGTTYDSWMNGLNIETRSMDTVRRIYQ